MAGLGAQQPGRALLLGHKLHFPSPRSQGNPQTCPQSRISRPSGPAGTQACDSRLDPGPLGPGPRCAERRTESSRWCPQWSALEGARLTPSGQLPTLEGRPARGTLLGQHQRGWGSCPGVSALRRWGLSPTVLLESSHVPTNAMAGMEATPGTLTVAQGSPGRCGDGSKRPAEAGTGLLPAPPASAGWTQRRWGRGGRRTRPTLSQATGHRPRPTREGTRQRRFAVS